ncbi:hypothetical protein CS8_071700 [Cupriavidus sp. 8B]
MGDTGVEVVETANYRSRRQQIFKTDLSTDETHQLFIVPTVSACDFQL